MSLYLGKVVHTFSGGRLDNQNRGETKRIVENVYFRNQIRK